MIQVSNQVRNGAAYFTVKVRAASIERAISMTGGQYPGGEVKVLLPIDAELFSAWDLAEKPQRRVEILAT